MPPEPSFSVESYSLALVERPGLRHPLYEHQAEVWDRWATDKTTLLAAKTGAGKTRAAMLPILKNSGYGVAVYPTNELLRDQLRAVEAMALGEGIKTVVWRPGTDPAGYSEADTILVPVDGPILDKWQAQTHCKSRAETLRRLLEPDKSKIVFTNPDILFGILAMRYGAEGIGSLPKYETLIFDEFHLYQGVELAHALTMVGISRTFGFFSRLLLLSATPHPDVRQILVSLYSPRIVEPSSGHSEKMSRVAVHQLEVTPVQLPANDPVDVLCARLVVLRPELERLRAENENAEYLPAVVIVNSVVNAIRIEDKLVEAGFSRDSLAIIRGLSNRDIRNTKGKLLALGTSAIEVGVDFHCDYLLFEASEASSFMQRFGRVGRHRPGKAIAFVPPNAYSGMSQLPPRIDRAAFESRINDWYPSADAKPWFVTTHYGMITAQALAETFIDNARRSGVSEATETKLRRRVEEMFDQYSSRLGCENKNVAARGEFTRWRAGKKHASWLKAYCNLNQFRTSLPSIEVHDFTEMRRRNDWHLADYEADLQTLLKRAKGIKWNAELGKVTIAGIGSLRNVHTGAIFEHDDISQTGEIRETKDYQNLRLYQDGDSTPISDLMGEKNHIFAVVPKNAASMGIDWRVPVFEAGTYLIAFDGAALLLLEIVRRNRANLGN